MAEHALTARPARLPLCMQALRIEKHIGKLECNAAFMRDRLQAWRAEVRAALGAQEVVELLHELLDEGLSVPGHAAVQKHIGEGLSADEVTGDELSDVIGALHDLKAAGECMVAEAAAAVQSARVLLRVIEPGKARRGPGREYVSQGEWHEGYNTLAKQRARLTRWREQYDETAATMQSYLSPYDRDHRGRQQHRPGWLQYAAMPLPTKPALAAHELEVLRAAGKAPLSSREAAVLASGMVPWRTDAYAVPQGSGLCCLLWAFCAAAGCTLAELGLSRDPVLRGAAAASFKELTAACQRHPGQPAAALALRKMGAQGWSILLEKEGVFLFSAWRMCGERDVPHAMAYNAGTRVLYIGPEVEVLLGKDLADLRALDARMEAEHGVYLGGDCQSRQLHCQPGHAAFGELPYVGTWVRESKRARGAF